MGLVKLVPNILIWFRQLESGGGGELENINIEREAINRERKLVKNTLAYNNNLPESNQEKDFQNFDMDYFEHFR